MDNALGLGPMLDPAEWLKLVLRFAINFAFASVVIRLVYYRQYRDHSFLFTFYLMNAITFMLCFLLRKVPAGLGFALAIFAVFGILRFRTEQIKNRDLTYLFIVIGIGVVNAVANKSVDAAELLTVNAIIAGLTYLIASGSAARTSWTILLYDKLELLQPGRQEELLRDISERVGRPADRVEVESIDLLRDAATVRVLLRPPEAGVPPATTPRPASTAT